jgi:hypothetical protein
MEERFVHQRNNERTTTVFDTFVYPSGSTLKDTGVNEILTLA